MIKDQVKTMWIYMSTGNLMEVDKDEKNIYQSTNERINR